MIKEEWKLVIAQTLQLVMGRAEREEDKAKAKEGASLRLVLASRRSLRSLLRSEDGASREKKSSRQRMAKKRGTRRWPTRSMM